MLRPRASYSHLACDWLQWRGIRLSGFIAFSLRRFVIVSSEICYKGVLLLLDLCPSVVEQNIICTSAKEIDMRCCLGLRPLRPSGLGRTSRTP